MSSDVQPRSSRKTLWVIAFVCIAPFVGSFALYYFYQPSRYVNYGKLMEPGKLPVEPLLQTDGNGFMLRQLEGKWVFVVADDGPCDEYCEKKLWQIRQIRLTQGKYPERIERLWLVTGQGEPGPRLRTDYSGTWIVRAEGSALLSALPFERSYRDHIYLIDPLGNLVIRYPRDADATRIRKDLERLLRVSRIG